MSWGDKNERRAGVLTGGYDHAMGSATENANITEGRLVENRGADSTATCKGTVGRGHALSVRRVTDGTGVRGGPLADRSKCG